MANLNKEFPIVDLLRRGFDDDFSYFVRDFLDNYLGDFRVPWSGSIHSFDGVSGLTIYRQNPYQVQLFILQPNVIIPQHMHPNIDSYEIFLTGVKLSYKNHMLNRDWGHACNDGVSNNFKKIIRIKPGEMHGGLSSDTGGAFISAQCWKNGLEPSSVSNDWVGDVIGEDHKKQIEANS